MSALTVLSVVAPVIPGIPNGTPEEAASGFRDLLAALAGEATVAPPAKDAAEAPATDEVEPAAEEAPVDATGFLAAPPMLPTPLVLPAAEDPQVPADLEGSAGLAGKTGEDPLVWPDAPAGDPVRPDGTAPLLAEKRSAPKTPTPEVQPPMPDLRPVRTGRAVGGETPETALTLSETAALTAATEAAARTATPAPSAALPTAPPAPLRPLAERTARPLDAAVAGSNEPVQPAGAARPGPETPPAAAAPANPPSGPADLAAAAAAAAVADSGEADDSPPEPLLTTEGATAQAQAPTGGRETGVSQLSRATIEATAQIAAQILRRLEGRSTRFEMALTPDELGRVDVKLDIDSEGRLNARLAFDNPAAATDLRGRADELRRQLEDAGFHLADDAFEFTERDSNSNAFDRGQDARNGSSRAFAAASRLNTEIDVAQPPRWLALTLSPSGVDMKV